MTVYEIAFITEKGDADVQRTAEDIIAQHKGTVTQKNDWGERAFSYRIGTLTKGFYHIWNFTITPDQLVPLKKRLNIEGSVIRYLILKVD